jgi:hypothetical protein
MHPVTRIAIAPSSAPARFDGARICEVVIAPSRHGSGDTPLTPVRQRPVPFGQSIERAVGLSAVEADFAADRVHVTIRASRPGLAWGFIRRPGAEGAWREPAAAQLRGELEELTGKQVRLAILEVPGPQDASPENASPII